MSEIPEKIHYILQFYFAGQSIAEKVDDIFEKEEQDRHISSVNIAEELNMTRQL